MTKEEKEKQEEKSLGEISQKTKIKKSPKKNNTKKI